MNAVLSTFQQGTESNGTEQRHIYIHSVVPNGAADLDRRIKPGNSLFIYLIFKINPILNFFLILSVSPLNVGSTGDLDMDGLKRKEKMLIPETYLYICL